MSYAIVHCPCPNEFQDKRYGNQRRVANLTQKAKSPERAVVRCTSCGKEHETSKSAVQK